MGRIHEDRFQHGDLVTWRDEDKATATCGRERLGNRLTIKDTRDVGRYVRDVGHTQQVTLMEDPNAGFNIYDPLIGLWGCSCYSGAYFRHLAPWER